jgi:hypothetical protein
VVYVRYDGSSRYYLYGRSSLAKTLNKGTNLLKNNQKYSNNGGIEMKLKYKTWFMYATMAAAVIISMADPVWPRL